VWTSDRPIDRLIDRIVDRPNNRRFDRTIDRVMDRTMDRIVDRIMDRIVGRIIDRLADRLGVCLCTRRASQTGTTGASCAEPNAGLPHREALIGVMRAPPKVHLDDRSVSDTRVAPVQTRHDSLGVLRWQTIRALSCWVFQPASADTIGGQRHVQSGFRPRGRHKRSQTVW